MLPKPKILLLLLLSLFLSLSATAQSLNEKLAKQTDFRPLSSTPLDQLVEIAKNFKLPMGIEWLDIKSLPADETAPKSQSVQDLIDSVLKRSPGHVAVIESGVLHIYPAELASSKLNFLNLKIASFSENEANLFEAEAELQLAISATLYPEHFKNGYNGGCGYPPDDVFTIRNITFEAQHVTVRELLSRITSQNGNSLWVVKLQPDEFRVKRPQWRHTPLDQYGGSPLASRWKFIPLSTIAELATEQIVVEFTIEPLISVQRVVIPAIPEYRLVDLRGIGMGGGSGAEGGGNCSYGLTIKETRADGIVFSFNSTVELPGQPREVVNEEFTVTKAANFETSYGPRVHIKAWFEPRVTAK